MEQARFIEARNFLAGYLARTRLLAAPSLQRGPNQRVYLKLESEQPTGSFKVRGALYALHRNMQRCEVREVVASSTGNHGAAVAYAAKQLGVKARIFLPVNSNPVKKANIARLGAAFVEEGLVDLAAAFEAAADYARKTGAFFLNDADDPDLPAGPGTIAREILEEQADVEVIYVPMGDTALIRGVAEAAKQISGGVRVVGVQSERAPSYALSWKAGHAVGTETCDTIADGLATRTPLGPNVETIRLLVDEVMLVSEQEMLDAIRRLAVDEHVVSEPAGAAATAAFLKSNASADGTAVLLVTGANVSGGVFRAAIGV
ncbi:MAG TPA: pyridoxal-phosphate dependent enzyme [Candidatus Eisenbacteria bacterium]|nr:pyridoxal-phosphate dependent enzyme [Candidatus Eisenbacteria bacterium]